MKNLRRLSKLFMYAAIVTFVAMWLIFFECAGYLLTEEVYALVYILFMIPVIFAAMAVSLRFIAKAIDPNYKGDRNKNYEVPVVLPPD